MSDYKNNRQTRAETAARTGQTFVLRQYMLPTISSMQDSKGKNTSGDSLATQFDRIIEKKRETRVTLEGTSKTTQIVF